MSGSLTRLVLRAQGRLPVAEPLLPSRYATGPQAAGFSEDVGIELAAQPSSSPGEPAIPVARTVPASAPAALRPSIGARSETVAEASESPPLAEARRTAPGTAPRPTIAERPAAASSPPRRVLTAPEPAHAAPLEPLRYPDTPSRRNSEAAPPGAAPVTAIEPALRIPDRRPSPGVSPFLAREAALAAARSARIETPRSETPASAPDVHISIGRVEVHAATARPAPVRVAPARHSGLSLADYLARRR